jgi:competence protein ComEC
MKENDRLLKDRAGYLRFTDMTPRSLGHRAPLLWLVLPLMGGLALGKTAGVAPVPWLLGCALVAAGLAVTALSRAPRLWAPALVAAMVLAGWASYALHRNRLPAWETLPPREVRLALRLAPCSLAARSACTAKGCQSCCPATRPPWPRTLRACFVPRLCPTPRGSATPLELPP